MRVVVYGTGRSDKIVLERFAEFAGLGDKRRIQVKGSPGGNLFGVDYILKQLPKIAEALCGEVEKLIIVLDASELRKKKEHKHRREWMEGAADAVPQGMTIVL